MRLAAPRHGRTAIALWLVFIFACSITIGRSQFTADLSAFLPRNPSPAQQLLLDQIRDGMASRLILVGIEGDDAPTRARISKKIAEQLRTDAAFLSISNGESANSEHDRAFFFNNRYLLSPAVTPERFSVTGLRTAVNDSLDLIASPAGMLTRALLLRDPTGEMVQLLQLLNRGDRPQLIDGAWASRDGARALILVRTRAPGSDTDAQQIAMNTIRLAFDTARGTKSAVQLVMTGPGVFSVTSRETIKSQVHRLSFISIALIVVLLLFVYRSFTALTLGLLPVITGVVAGIAAVSLGFGVVHGITLGFGTALIGEAVDYSIYLFLQSEQEGTYTQDWIQRFWPTVRLGVLTSICGFASLLLSGFPGLAQLGLYAITGLITAALVTRFVLPYLLPASFRVRDVSAIGVALATLVARAAALRGAAILLVLAACAVLFLLHAQLWNNNLSSLSPVSQAEVALDTKLRADLGAPDTRYLVVVAGKSREVVLQDAEAVSAILQKSVDDGELTGYESPSRYLPSVATQRVRQASLPPPTELERRLAHALEGLPLRAERLTPFVEDVARARNQSPLQATDLEKTSMAMAVDAMLIQRGEHWNALLPLTAPTGADINAERIRAVLRDAAVSQAMLVDLKTESNHMYAGYLHEAIVLALGGLVAIIVLLLVVTRSMLRTLRIIAPLAAAVITVAAGLAAAGQQMTLLHLVGLLLVVAVGSNYALFFDRPVGTASSETVKISPRTLASMLLANVTTVIGFGLLAFSKVSILQALGVTVAPGVVLALIFAAVFAKTTHV